MVTSFVLSLELLKQIQHQLLETIMLPFTKILLSLLTMVLIIVGTIATGLQALVRVMLRTLVTRLIEIQMLTEIR